MKKYTIKAVFKISTKPVLMSKTGNEILLSALVEYFQYFYFTGNFYLNPISEKQYYQ